MRGTNESARWKKRTLPVSTNKVTLMQYTEWFLERIIEEGGDGREGRERERMRNEREEGIK